MANGGDNMVREFVKRTVWVDVDRKVTSEQYVVSRTASQVEAYVNYIAEHINETVSTEIVS